MPESLAVWLWLAASTWLGQPPYIDFIEISPEPVQVALELIREEQVMGEPRPLLVKEGTLSNAGPRLFCPPKAGMPRTELRLEEAWPARLCVLRTDFTLHPLDGRKEFRRVTVRLDVASPGVEVLDLYPRSLVRSGEEAHSLSLSWSGAQLLPLPAGAPHPGPFSVVDLRPVVTGHRETGPAAYWIFTSPEGRIPIGMRSVFTLVSVPASLSALAGSVQYESDIGAQIFGLFRMPGTAKTQAIGFEIRLTGAGPKERELGKQQP